MPALCDPLTINGLHLANRLVMPPMVTGLAEEHAPSAAQLAWYSRYAASGVGLVIVEAAAVRPDGLLVERELGAWADAQVDGLARLAGAIHAAGAPAILQLVHGGARAHRPDPGVERVAPSAVRLFPGPPPRPLEVEEIAALIECFAAAARRAVAAGFDGVEIHAAHYYLLSQFLSPWSNRREDAYGGDACSRARALLEVVAAVRREIGRAVPLLVRMHCVERMEGGLSVEDAGRIARLLEAVSVDAIDASAVGQASMLEDDGQPYLMTSSALARSLAAGDNLPYAARLRQAVGIPVIAVGKLGVGAVAEGALADGAADLVAIGRQLIADPLTARKMLDGRSEEIVRCKDCFRCYASIRNGSIRCSVNRELGPPARVPQG